MLFRSKQAVIHLIGGAARPVCCAHPHARLRIQPTLERRDIEITHAPVTYQAALTQGREALQRLLECVTALPVQ